MKNLSSRILIFTLILAGMSISPIATAQEASILYFSTDSQIITQGEIFEVDIMVSSGRTYVNAIGAYFSYPDEKLEVVDIYTSESALLFFVKKDARAGKVEIIGGQPTPGIIGVNKIATVKFRVKANSGAVTLAFGEGSAVFTNETNLDILDASLLEQGNYTIETATLIVEEPTQVNEASVVSVFVGFLTSLFR
ncbi:hypothetical protein IID24_04925 [Patescibacteria group bacterium]|nr:hypothetical protein [Patescibacteria group bacterium]